MKYFALALFAGSAVGKMSFPSSWAEFDGEHLTMESLFGRFKLAYGRAYSSHDEEKMHFEVFSKRVHDIFDFNAEGKHTYQKGINKYIFLFGFGIAHHILDSPI